MHTFSDAELIARAANGSAESLGYLFDRHSGRMKAIAMRIVRAPEDADDVVQEAFVQAWLQADRFDASRGTVLAWLSIITRSRALDRWRRQTSRRESSVTDAPELASPPAPPLPAIVWAARGALTELPPGQREPLELAYWEGLSQSEIAQRLKVPLGTVKTRMRSGLRRLREIL